MKKLELMTEMEQLYQCFLVKSQLLTMTSDEIIAEYPTLNEYCVIVLIFEVMYNSGFLLIDESIMKKSIDYFSYYRDKYNRDLLPNFLSNEFAGSLNNYGKLSPNEEGLIKRATLVRESIDHGLNPFFTNEECIKKIIDEDIHQFDAILLLDKKLLKPTFPESLTYLLRYDDFVSKQDFIVSSNILLDIYGDTILHDEASKVDAKVYRKVKSTMNKIMRV